MPAGDEDLHKAEEFLKRADPAMARLVESVGPCTMSGRRSGTSAFAALAGSIVYQQLAGRAAQVIHGRVISAVGGRLTPAAVLATPEPALRAAGLSASKAGTMRSLAEAFLDGTVPARSIAKMSDTEVIQRLTVVKGIGPWTAEMFLIFHLQRLDVWPTTDYGVRKGYALTFGLSALPAPRELQPLGERFQPYRSVLAWYLWRAVDQAVQGVG